MNDSDTNNFESNVRERKSRIKTSDFRVGDKVQFELEGTIIKGDSVKIFFKGDSHVGVVREITQSYGQILFRVEFDYNGKTKNRLFYDSQVIKFQLD